MSRAYIYMSHPETGELLTLGRLAVSIFSIHFFTLHDAR